MVTVEGRRQRNDCQCGGSGTSYEHEFQLLAKDRLGEATCHDVLLKAD